MTKVTVVGAGNVGATCADVLAYREIAEQIVLVDIKEGIAEGKALDIWQKAPINQYDSRTVGSTNDYSKTADSDVIVITSGLPRKPGMTRDDLIETNAGIVKSVTENVVKHSPNAIIIVVSNPLDVMTYQAHITSGFSRSPFCAFSTSSWACLEIADNAATMMTKNRIIRAVIKSA